MTEPFPLPNIIEGAENFCSSCAKIPFNKLLKPIEDVDTSMGVGTRQIGRKLWPWIVDYSDEEHDLHQAPQTNIEITGGQKGHHLAFWLVDHVALESSCPLCSFLRDINIPVEDWTAPRHISEGWTHWISILCISVPAVAIRRVKKTPPRSRRHFMRRSRFVLPEGCLG